jgi:serine/threonine-protein kinase
VTTSVPYVAGSDVNAAIDQVLRAGLVPMLEADRDPRARIGRVRAQVPAAGTGAAAGSVVRLSVGGGYGSGAVNVPNVTGLPAADATSQLRAAGLTVQTVPVPTSLPWAPRGTVVAQSPLGPSARSDSSVVTLWVSDR